ncbi:sigma-70 family RNA polymerase sigma factor [Streptomyces sp. JNUCC 63]
MDENLDTNAASRRREEHNVELCQKRTKNKKDLEAAEGRLKAAEADPNATEDELHPLEVEQMRLSNSLDRVTEKIIKFNESLVRACVKRFTQVANREDQQEFEAAAVVGLVRAIDTFDPDKGQFRLWAYAYIKWEVLRAVRDVDYPNMNPSDFERRPHILRAKADLVAESGDNAVVPSFEDIARRAGTTVEQVARVLGAPRLESLSALVGDDGDTELSDVIPDTSADIDETVMTGMSAEALLEHGLPVLDGRELYVIIRRYGLDGEDGQDYSAIGEQLHLSREAIRQIEAKAITKLRDPSVIRKLHRPTSS